MSFIQKIWKTFRNPVRYKGRDLEGNVYYESRSLVDPTRTKRTVRYYDPEELWRYTGGGKRLPVQWSSWLTHTRLHPPTLDELEADALRQRRMVERVALIEAKDREEAEHMRHRREQDAQLAIEEAVAGRGEPMSESGVTQKPNAVDQSANLGPRSPAESSQIRPPRFVTPASPRSRKSLSPFSLPSVDSSTAEPQNMPSEVEGSDSNSSKSTNGLNPWKSSATDTESWTPKARKRQ